MGFGFNAPKDNFGMPAAVPKTHLGVASCNLLKEYTSSYPCLREVGILLKEFLSIHDLNSAYLGKSEIALVALISTLAFTLESLLAKLWDFYFDALNALITRPYLLLAPLWSKLERQWPTRVI